MLLQASSQGPPVSAVVYAAASSWLSTVRPAPLWLFSEFGAVYKYSDLLTYVYRNIYTGNLHCNCVFRRRKRRKHHSYQDVRCLTGRRSWTTYGNLPK